MNNVLIILCFIFSTGSLLADIPSGFALDGTPLKGEDTRGYEFTRVDYAYAKSNPMKLGIQRVITEGDDDFHHLAEQMKAYPFKKHDRKFRTAFVRTKTVEIPLSAKEKKAYQEKKSFWNTRKDYARGVRQFTVTVFAIKGKEYDFEQAGIVGSVNIDKKGPKELLTVFYPRVTHAGGTFQLRLIGNDGSVRWVMDSPASAYQGVALLDTNNDGYKEIIVRVRYNQKNEIRIIGPGGTITRGQPEGDFDL